MFTSSEFFHRSHPTTGVWDEVENPLGLWGNTSLPNTQFISKESPVGDIFINEYDHFKDHCLFEINCDKLNGKSFRDTTGNGNEGILLGDFSIKKDEVGQPVSRDSYIKVPKVGSKNGAF